MVRGNEIGNIALMAIGVCVSGAIVGHYFGGGIGHMISLSSVPPCKQDETIKNVANGKWYGTLIGTVVGVLVFNRIFSDHHL